MFRLNQIGNKPSIKKAVYLLERSYLKNKEKMAGLKFGKSDISIRKYWKTFLNLFLTYGLLIRHSLYPQKLIMKLEQNIPHLLIIFYLKQSFSGVLVKIHFLRKLIRQYSKKMSCGAFPADYAIPDCNPVIEEPDDWLRNTINDYSVY